MSSQNPFLEESALNAPLELEFCQHIHLLALRRAADGRACALVPTDLPVDALRHQARWYGSSSLLSDPETVGQLFQGITLAVYRTIETLYCCRPRRSAPIIWRILRARAQEAGVAGVTYEAVWAICEYLEKKRAASLAVTKEVSAALWWLLELRPNVTLQEAERPPYAPSLVCMFQARPPRVLAFHVVWPEAVQEGAALALFQALVSQRFPTQTGAAGLCWRLPKEIWSELDLGHQFLEACAALSLPIQQAESGSCSLHGALQLQGWAQMLSRQGLTRSHLALSFDTYLAKCLGAGPLRLQRASDLRYARLKGYAREPIWQFPALSQLLPHRAARIGADGCVAYDGLHYVDELLAYWPEQEVTLMQFPAAEAWAWVYLKEEFLCQAGARELQRRDGSYRPNRPGR